MSNDYVSDIVLGAKYRDNITGIEGIAVSVHFYRNREDNRVVLNYLHDGDLKDPVFDAADLTLIEPEN